MPQVKRPISDTVSVTADGRIEVDVRKLFAKQHMRDMMRQMREKTVRVSRTTHSRQVEALDSSA